VRVKKLRVEGAMFLKSADVSPAGVATELGKGIMHTAPFGRTAQLALYRAYIGF
jgi:hypothetical protein